MNDELEHCEKDDDDDESPIKLFERISPDIFDGTGEEDQQEQQEGGPNNNNNMDVAYEEEEDDIAMAPDPHLRYAAEAHVEAEIAKMNPTERETIYFDVHGISSLPVETPELVRESLANFQSAIDALLKKSATNKHKRNNESGFGLRGIFSTQAYETALSMDPHYVEHPERRLAFLRREKFLDPASAAKRYIRWFSVKLDLFGTNLLTETITQDDLASLDDDDEEQESSYVASKENENNSTTNTTTTAIKALTDGYKQILPLRDNAGRLVFCDLVGNSCNDTLLSGTNKLRRKFYMAMVASEDPETQLKGAIMVWYAVGAATDEAPLDNWGFVRGLFAVLDCLPLRMEAIHSCHNNHWRYAAKVALFRLTCGIFLSARTRVHVGPHHKCLFVLQTYGM